MIVRLFVGYVFSRHGGSAGMAWLYVLFQSVFVCYSGRLSQECKHSPNSMLIFVLFGGDLVWWWIGVVVVP